MKERVLLAIIDRKKKDGWPVHQEAYEMEELVKACQGEVVGKVICPLATTDASTFVHKGKAEEIAGLVTVLEANTVVFSAELKGHHQRNLEEMFGVKVLDRTTLILDIFARRATSAEGKLQVELAQLQYRLPRLTGTYEGLSRQGGGIGTLGPGETKLESDRRRIGERIDRLKKELINVTRSRQLKRKKREGKQVPLIALVGYTNAGKSTLLNTMTDAGQTTKDGLFTTLDSLSRQCVLPNRQKVVFADTVGFMHDLPHNLIEAFKATLEEVQSADVLLHVIDASNPEYLNFKASVESVLEELESLKKPTILVLNKADLVEDKDALAQIQRRFENSVIVSAREKFNIGALLSKIEDQLTARVLEIDIFIPMDRMDLIHCAHREGDVILEEYTAEGIHLRAFIPTHLAAAFGIAPTPEEEY